MTTRHFLDAAVTEFEIEIDEDGDLYAHDGLEFPVWIEALPDSNLIAFMNYQWPEKTVGVDWLARVNTMNKKMVAVQFHWSDQVVWGKYWMSYDGGLNARQFIKMVRRFNARGDFELVAQEQGIFTRRIL